MRLDILGIIEDGSPRGSAVPQSSGTPVRIPQGVDVVLNVVLVTSNGAAAYTDPLDRYEMHLAKSPGAVVLPPFVGTRALLTGPNVVAFAIPANKTRSLSPGQYVYDVWRIRDTNREQVVALSAFQLLAAAFVPTNTTVPTLPDPGNLGPGGSPG